MGSVDTHEKECSSYKMLLKVMLTKNCTVEQKNPQVLKAFANYNMKRARRNKTLQNSLATNEKQKETKGRPEILGHSRPGGPAIRTTMVMRPRNFAPPARTVRGTRTKRKRRRNKADSPMTQGEQAPLNLLFRFSRINAMNLYRFRHAYFTCVPISRSEHSKVHCRKKCLFRFVSFSI